jgi:hypothetical protein
LHPVNQIGFDADTVDFITGLAKNNKKALFGN